MRTFLLIILAIFCFSTASFSIKVYVNAAAQGLNTGSSWQDAYTDLQAALSISPFPDTVWIAEGIYYPTQGTDRYRSFDLPSGIVIFGGFTGNEHSLSQRDWENHPTVLSGDIGIPGDLSDNSFSVLTARWTDTTTIIDGLTVVHGNANSDINLESAYGKTKSGGGLHVDGQGTDNQSDIQIRNCTFMENEAIVCGGAINFSGYGGSTGFIIENCRFISNKAFGSGGAIGKQGNCKTIQRISSCFFEGNWADYTGGAFSCYDQNVTVDLTIENCEFLYNEATLGGAISRNDFGTPSYNDLLINNCRFEHNSASNYGGAIYIAILTTGEIVIHNCLFEKNEALKVGGAIFSEAFDQCDFTISQTRFTSNTSIQEASILYGLNFRINALSNLFVNNHSDFGPCIRLFNNLEAMLVNNTFFKNGTLSNHEIIEVNGGNISLLNSILWENQADSDQAFFELNGAQLEIGSSIMDYVGCETLVDQGNNAQLNCQTNVLFGEYPQFRDTANLDFSIRSCSPGINAGQNSVATDLGIFQDLLGNDRIKDGVVDIGAFEQTAFMAAIESAQDVSCFSENDGSVNLNVQGTVPLIVFWETGNDTGINTENLNPGDYTYFISDADGCNDTLEFQIFEPGPLQSDEITVNHIDCPGRNNGRIEIFSSGGVPPYEYIWNHGSDDAIVEDLAPGLYQVTVSDTNGCSTVEAINLSEPDELQVEFVVHEASASNSADGSIMLNSISGGSPGYSYLWNDGSTTPSLSGLYPGHYELTITDAHSCDYVYGFSISFTSAVNGPGSDDIRVFPNPASELVSISLEKGARPSTRFLLFNNLGQQLIHEEIAIGQKEWYIKTKSLAPGSYVYFIKEAQLELTSGVLMITK